MPAKTKRPGWKKKNRRKPNSYKLDEYDEEIIKVIGIILLNIK